jgi:DNA modification methylase
MSGDRLLHVHVFHYACGLFRRWLIHDAPPNYLYFALGATVGSGAMVAAVIGCAEAVVMRPVFLRADARRIPLATGSVHACVTSPPYLWQRLYDGPRAVFGGEADCAHEWELCATAKLKIGNNMNVRGQNEIKDRFSKPKWEGTSHQHLMHAGDFCVHCGAWRGQLGLEPTPDLYLEHLVGIFREVRRVLRDDGTLFVNIDDKRTKDRQWMMIPERFALLMQADGWRLEDKCVWHERSCMPGSQRNRFTHDYEHVFMFNKSKRAFFDIDAVRERTGSEMSEGEYQAKINAGTWPSGGLTNNAWGAKKDGGQSHPAGRSPRAVWSFPHARLADDLTDAELEELAALGYVELVEGDGGDGDVWDLKPESYGGNHYAAFPSSLPAKCIRAATSERGCCPTCGAPWERVTERGSNFLSTSGERGHPGRYGDTGNGAKGLGMPSIATTVNTVTWQPTCSCPPTDPVPCTVLDPFGGTGTTAIAATMLGRRGIALDISGEYVGQAKRRWYDTLRRSQAPRVRGRVSDEALEAGMVGKQERLL